MNKKILFAIVLLAGCRGGYKAPEIAMSPEFVTNAAKQDFEAFNPSFWEVLGDETLNRLVFLTKQQNFDVQIALEKIQQLRASYRFQNSQLFPQIGGQTTVRRERDTQTLTFSQFTGNIFQTIYTMGFDATWELDFFGAQQAAKRSAFFQMMSQQEKSSYVLLTVVSELVLQYVNLRTQQALQDNYIKEKELLVEIQDLSHGRFEAGLNDQTSSLLNLARLQEKQALIDKTTGDIDKLVFLVTKITGQFPDKEYESLKKPISLNASIPLIYQRLPSQIILARPDVSEARYNLFSAQAQLKKAYRDFFPQFNITSFFGAVTNFPNLWFKKQSLQWDIMPGFNVTLIDFGALIAQKNVAKSQEKQALFAYESSLVSAFSELETALAGVKATNEQIAYLEKELETLKEKTSDFSERYRLGLIDKLPYLESKLEEYLLNERLIEAVNNRYGFSIAFYKALGVRL